MQPARGIFAGAQYKEIDALHAEAFETAARGRAQNKDVTARPARDCVYFDISGSDVPSLCSCVNGSALAGWYDGTVTVPEFVLEHAV